MSAVPAFKDRPTAPQPLPDDRHWLLELKFLYHLEHVVCLGFHLPEAEFEALLDRVRHDATQTVLDHLWRHA